MLFFPFPASGFVSLGSATGATTTVGPVIWSPNVYRSLLVYYTITGYNGGTPVGRLLCGNASISTTAANNGNVLSENFAAVTSTSVSVPGCPLATSLSAIARHGVAMISGESGSLKRIVIEGAEGNPAAASSPTIFFARSSFTDLGTNLLLDRVQLTVFDTLTATSASAQTFNAGTRIDVYGAP